MNLTESTPTLRENAMEHLKPAMTVFLLRHGESETDKINPNRGLTEKGKKQVEESVDEILKLVESEGSENVEFHLRDSGTERTEQQVIWEYELLTKKGIDPEQIIIPDKILARMNVDITDIRPGTSKRLKGVQGLDSNPEFRTLIKSKEYQEFIGAQGDVEAWALSPEDKIPDDVESLKKMQERYSSDISKLESLVHRGMVKGNQKIIVLANSHASIATLAAAQESGISLTDLMRKLGEEGDENEVPGAQGVRYDFYKEEKARMASPFGKEVVSAVEKIKRKI